MGGVGTGLITVFLADDDVIVREGVRALLGLEDDLEVVGTADDHDSPLAGAEAAAPQVLVTDIRMPPSFQREGIDAAKELRKDRVAEGNQLARNAPVHAFLIDVEETGDE
jgi:DNA-binding NarL/FixJ family response regulator